MSRRPKPPGPTRRVGPAVPRVIGVSLYPLFRAGLETMLRGREIRFVGSTDTPDKVLALVKATRPHAVIIDTESVSNWVHLVPRLRRQAPQVAVVAMGAEEPKTWLSTAVAVGCSGFLSKRAERHDFVRIILSLARNESVIEPGLLRRVLSAGGEPSPELPSSGDRPRLKPAELQVLQLLVEGLTNREIGKRLDYALATVKSYVRSTMDKLGVSHRTQAAVKAVQLHLV